jgi:hypothetical protein
MDTELVSAKKSFFLHSQKAVREWTRKNWRKEAQIMGNEESFLHFRRIHLSA